MKELMLVAAMAIFPMMGRQGMEDVKEGSGR